MATNEKEVRYSEAFDKFAKGKRLDPKKLWERIHNAVCAAVRKKYPGSKDIGFDVDEEGDFIVYIVKKVVEKVEDSQNQISLDDAHYYDEKLEIGDDCIAYLENSRFGQVAAQVAKEDISYNEALGMLAKEKGLDPEVLKEKIQTAVTIAVRKEYPRSENIGFDIDEKGAFVVSIIKEVVEDVEDEANQICLEEARRYGRNLKIGDSCVIRLDTKRFGRIAAQTAKQVIKQGIKDVERSKLLEQWGEIQNEAVSVKVVRVESGTGNAMVEINGNEEPLFRSEQLPGDELHENDMIRVYVCGATPSDRRPTLKLSRTNRDFIKRLFEIEVPEIYDGIVEIKSISREAGQRSKMAVISNDPNVDALGACIGPQRSRVSKISEELCGEKIDIVTYSDDPCEFIKQSLKPADVISVDIPDENVKNCTVVVPDNQLSLAIGNKGLNAKLAAKLTGYKIDIKPESGFFEG